LGLTRGRAEVFGLASRLHLACVTVSGLGTDAIVGGVSLCAIGADWTVDAIYDTNGDFTADIMLKNTTSGQFYLCGLTNNAVTSSAALGTDWQLI
jgi:hypothetical protein